MINEGQDTSTNKTHLFNWLYDMTVQMARGGGGGVRQMCARRLRCVRLCMRVFDWVLSSCARDV